MRDDDRMLDLPEAEFGSGVVGVCDICGVRQAVVILTKERFRLCVLDFLNKTWLKTEKKPGAPLPLYRTERVRFETTALGGRDAPALAFSPTKVVRHPAILVAPDVFGITTTVLDAAIRFAREGFEVLVPDVGKTDGVGLAYHASLRSGATFRGGVSVRSPRSASLVALYGDALRHLLEREMVDSGHAGLFGTSYGASLAIGLAAENTRLKAVSLAYPRAVRPRDVARLITAPVQLLYGSRDGTARRAVAELRASLPSASVVELDGVRHNFLARDLGAYNLVRAEEAWEAIVRFLKDQLVPPAPRPPPAPVKFPVAPGPGSLPVAAPPGTPAPG